MLYIKTPKGYFPQDDTGLVCGGTQASPDISFKAMVELQQQAADIVLADPAVAASARRSAVGVQRLGQSRPLFISLKPLAERGGERAARDQPAAQQARHIPGIRVFMVPAQDMRVGGRQSDSQYQFTLWTPDFDELYRNGRRRATNRCRSCRARRRLDRPRAGRPAGQRA